MGWILIYSTSSICDVVCWYMNEIHTHVCIIKISIQTLGSRGYFYSTAEESNAGNARVSVLLEDDVANLSMCSAGEGESRTITKNGKVWTKVTKHFWSNTRALYKYFYLFFSFHSLQLINFNRGRLFKFIRYVWVYHLFSILYEYICTCMFYLNYHFNENIFKTETPKQILKYLYIVKLKS